MRKTLINLLLAGSLTFGQFIGTGCAPTASAISKRNFPKSHISNYNIQKRNQNQTSYQLERVVLHNQDYYMRTRDTTETRENQLSFAISRVGDNTLALDLDSSKAELLPKKEYVPVLAEFDGYDSTKNEDKWADRVALNARCSGETGIRGIRAEITCLEQLRTKQNIPENSYGWTALTTEQDAGYSILTTTINGEEFFFPHIESQKADEFYLPFYLIPKKQAQLRIETDGTIKIHNTNNIYRPLLREHAEFPENEKYLGKTLFKTSKYPNSKYYVIGEKAFREYPNRKIELLCPEQTRQTREAISELEQKATPPKVSVEAD